MTVLAIRFYFLHHDDDPASESPNKNEKAFTRCLPVETQARRPACGDSQSFRVNPPFGVTGRNKKVQSDLRLLVDA